MIIILTGNNEKIHQVQSFWACIVANTTRRTTLRVLYLFALGGPLRMNSTSPAVTGLKRRYCAELVKSW